MGLVLDCNHGSPAALAAKAEQQKKASAQGCRDISSDPGWPVYKTGTNKNIRWLSRKPVDANQVHFQVHFQVMRMELRRLCMRAAQALAGPTSKPINTEANSSERHKCSGISRIFSGVLARVVQLRISKC